LSLPCWQFVLPINQRWRGSASHSLSVIRNYQNVAALTNPANDAAAITQMFEKASFDVVDSRRDLQSTEMRRALRDFTDKARGADIAVIYFAGHGLEVDGTNYVVR
jgi:uncharacterized caspase-like protein